MSILPLNVQAHLEAHLKRPAICFIDPFCPVGRRSAQAGVSYYLSRALNKHWGSVSAFGPLYAKLPLGTRVKSKLWRLFTTKRYLIRWDPTYCRDLAAQGDRLAINTESDVIFTIFPQIVPFFQRDLPIVVRTDMTFVAARRYGHAGVKRGCYLSYQLAMRLEKAAFARAALIVVSNHHCASSIVTDYHVHRSKVAVVGHGPHLDFDPGKESMNTRIRNRSVLNLLFVGSDWIGKGGQILLDAARHLQGMGLPALVSIVGPVPEECRVENEHTMFFGKLDKDIPEDMEQLDGLYRKCHFMVLPTRAEACAIVYNESCAYGMPIITTNVGGVRTAVRQGQNGVLLDISAKGAQWASAIFDIWQKPEQYKALCFGARRMYETFLNYETCAKSIKLAWERRIEGLPAMSDYSFIDLQ